MKFSNGSGGQAANYRRWYESCNEGDCRRIEISMSLEFIFFKIAIWSVRIVNISKMFNYSHLADSHPKRPLHGAERAEFAPGHFASICRPFSSVPNILSLCRRQLLHVSSRAALPDLCPAASQSAFPSAAAVGFCQLNSYAFQSNLQPGKRVIFYHTKHHFLSGACCTSSVSVCAVLFSLLQAAASSVCLSGSQSGYCNFTSLLLFKSERIFVNWECAPHYPRNRRCLSFGKKDASKPSRWFCALYLELFFFYTNFTCGSFRTLSNLLPNTGNVDRG